MKNIFKTGDTVYDFLIGEGTVVAVYELATYGVEVKFKDTEVEIAAPLYTEDGFFDMQDINPRLKLTPWVVPTVTR